MWHRRIAVVIAVSVVIGCSDSATPSTTTIATTTTTTMTTTTTSIPRMALSVTVIDDADQPIPNADVVVDGTPIDGRTQVSLDDFPIEIQVTAPGYLPASSTVFTPIDTVTIWLEPVTLHGTITTPEGMPLPDAVVSLGAVIATTGPDGTFDLTPAVPGTVSIERPAWMPATVDWDGSTKTIAAELEPRIVKAIHAVAWLPEGDGWGPFLDLADRTEINAVVFDIKDESGVIRYESNVPLAGEVGAVEPSYSLADVVTEMHRRGLYVIGRVVSFEDPIVASARPDLAIRVGSNAFRKGAQAFLDPTDPDARAYNLDVAIEACRAGIDEIQFDYVRFPTGLTSRMTLDGDGVYVGSAGQADRVGVIASFLGEARTALHELGCAVSADVFAIVLSTQNDQGIGQRPEETGGQVDALSPMVYPDHYSDGWIGFSTPADHPYAVVENALDDGMPRLPSATIMRPWIADFNYGASSVRAEIDAAESFELGWMLWNPGSRVTEGALKQTP